LQKVFLLRNCSDSVFDSRTRPCLLYQIKRCSAPCVGISMRRTTRPPSPMPCVSCKGDRPDLQAQLAAEQMAEAAEAMEFERAAALRDRIRALTQVQSRRASTRVACAEADVIALHMEGGQACVQVFFIRANQNWGNKDYYPRVGRDIEAPEVLEAFLGQFYDQKDPPRQLILSAIRIENADLMAEALSQKAGPQGRDRSCRSGARRRSWSTALCATPAKASRRQMAERQAQAQAAARGWPRPSGSTPRRADRGLRQLPHPGHECGGRDDRGRARRLREIPVSQVQHPRRDLTPGDDFGMMKEVLTRRFKRLLKEDPDREKGPGPTFC
jgi:excinuclease ABC subunit C